MTFISEEQKKQGNTTRLLYLLGYSEDDFKKKFNKNLKLLSNFAKNKNSYDHPIVKHYREKERNEANFFDFLGKNKGILKDNMGKNHEQTQENMQTDLFDPLKSVFHYILNPMILDIAGETNLETRLAIYPYDNDSSYITSSNVLKPNHKKLLTYINPDESIYFSGSSDLVKNSAFERVVLPYILDVSNKFKLDTNSKNKGNIKTLKNNIVTTFNSEPIAMMTNDGKNNINFMLNLIFNDYCNDNKTKYNAEQMYKVISLTYGLENDVHMDYQKIASSKKVEGLNKINNVIACYAYALDILKEKKSKKGNLYSDGFSNII